MRMRLAIFLGGLAGAAASVRGLHRTAPRLARLRAAMAVPSLDAKLIADSPEVVADSLRRRRAPEEQLRALETIGELQRRYSALSFEISNQLGVRKKLSPQIGALMKAGKESEVAALKEQVAQASDAAKRLEDELATIEAERARLLDALPNLLDPRVPNGKDDSENECVAEWLPPAGLKPASGVWHDDIAIKLGMLDLDGAAKISGARFSVRARPNGRIAWPTALWRSAGPRRRRAPCSTLPPSVPGRPSPPRSPPGAARPAGAAGARAGQHVPRPAHERRARLHRGLRPPDRRPLGARGHRPAAQI
jgi:hypothetical protein